MKTKKMLTISVLALGLILCHACICEAEEMGTAFTYQGRLMDKNKPADGPYSFQFRLYDSNDPCTGTLLESPIDINDLDVIDGHFVVELDFGSGIFDGNAVWLETRVVESPMGSDPATLSPMLELTPTPYALYAKTAGGDDDWMVSGNDMYSIPSGNVGIGTTEPQKKLEIASDSFTDLGIGLRINTPGGTSWSINNDVGIFKIDEHASCGPEFENNTRIAIVGNCIGSPYGGNVGIGTTSPETKLHVYESSSSDVYMSVEASSSDGEAGVRLKNPAGGWDVFANDENGDFGIAHALAERVLTIKNSTGNVGIGTESPDEKLHISGNVKIVDGNQGANKVLTSDANGVGSWQAPPASGLPSGVIVMWSGSIAGIPTGWALCDGNNGTPDLRDRFIVGAGNSYTIGEQGGSTSHAHTGATSTGIWLSSGCGQGCENGHYHTFTTDTSEHRPPYYALALIMKL